MNDKQQQAWYELVATVQMGPQPWRSGACDIHVTHWLEDAILAADTALRAAEQELSALRTVLTNADAHHGLVPSITMLREEVAELEAALAGNHPHPPELELTQIGGIVINWLRQYDLIPIPVGSSKLSALRAVAEAARPFRHHSGGEELNDALAALDAARGGREEKGEGNG